MHPATGQHLAAYVGQRLRVTVRCAGAAEVFLRSNLRSRSPRPKGALRAWQLAATWRDFPCRKAKRGTWVVDLPLTAVGHFRFKAYARDRRGARHWPDGPDAAISVHPACCRGTNTIYCAFVRLFGQTRERAATRDPLREEQLAVYDRHGWTVIPPSGTLRDLTAQVPHIIDELGFRIVHLLPITPTPTVFAKYGRYGSPYAATDFFSIDPALVEHDRSTTAFDQFQELATAVHARDGRLIIDVAINHTGWGSRLQNEHPEWFRREDGAFASPGAWGTVWEDLVELDHQHRPLWVHLAEVFLFWNRRGVDGFRCDAGYMVPLAAWRNIIQRVRQEFPECIFLLEGLGGAWETTWDLLGEGGMQWAYSELFQNHSGSDLAAYLPQAIRAGERYGTLVHYAETHDNERLAVRGRAWSLMRNRLCALVSQRGAYGITCGVEWLADERIEVHQSRGLRWGHPDNLVPEIRRLNQLLTDHPCFLDGATVEVLERSDRDLLAVERRRDDERLLVLVNLREDKILRPELPDEDEPGLGCDLLTNEAWDPSRGLPPYGVVCLGAAPWRPDGRGAVERRWQLLVAWSYRLLAWFLPMECIGPVDAAVLADLVAADPEGFCAALAHLDPERCAGDLAGSLREAMDAGRYPQVAVWTPDQADRVTPVPWDHILLVRHAVPFRLRMAAGEKAQHLASVPVDAGHVAAIGPQEVGAAELHLECTEPSGHRRYRADLRFLPADPPDLAGITPDTTLLTNGRGGMAHLQVDFGRVASKYDCALAANLHPGVPVDRHVLVKRVRVWANANGFATALDRQSLERFTVRAGVSEWSFRVGAGGGASLPIRCQAAMPPGRNATHLSFTCDSNLQSFSLQLVVRVDLEDRAYHHETHRDRTGDEYFRAACRALEDGFDFLPAEDRHLRVRMPGGRYFAEEEWQTGIAHPLEASRGQTATGDAYSPGYFRFDVTGEGDALLVLDAEDDAPGDAPPPDLPRALPLRRPGFLARLRESLDAYLVRRDGGRTVIAGYPWFLDWGRDTLICARGLLADGRLDEVRSLLAVFGRFAERGTLPNSLHGEDASDRDTVDAPLWYGLLAREYAAAAGADLDGLAVADGGRSVLAVLVEIAAAYAEGTPDGVRLDPDSGLVWSPSHFTWMDTAHPACTPREGYPLEVQALWIHLLAYLEELDAAPPGLDCAAVGGRARESLRERFWSDRRAYPADLLAAPAGRSAAEAEVDDAFRANAVLAVALGAFDGDAARATVLAAARHLVLPGALRSLAPLPVSLPLRIVDAEGRLLNDPQHPYWGRYEGDENTRRKPAYHNGTAWTWTFPSFCEAIVRAWPDDPAALAAARCHLGGMRLLLEDGCAGHLPELCDGDAPHRPRGCDAQAWGLTEALRVAVLLGLEDD